MSHWIFYLWEMKLVTAFCRFTVRCMPLSETEGKNGSKKREIKIYFREYGRVT